MHSPKERQAGRGLPFKQDHDQREAGGRPDPSVERLVVFQHLPVADALADQQDEGGRLGDFRS
jgi:hypothetical protein